jgi:hypothetical protein
LSKIEDSLDVEASHILGRDLDSLGNSGITSLTFSSILCAHQSLKLTSPNSAVFGSSGILYFAGLSGFPNAIVLM